MERLLAGFQGFGKKKEARKAAMMTRRPSLFFKKGRQRTDVRQRGEGGLLVKRWETTRPVLRRDRIYRRVTGDSLKPD